MRILILGWSSLVQRRVRPALASLDSVEAMDLASRRAAEVIQSKAWDSGQVYPDYGLALEQSSADLVYVSVVNSEHAHWAEEALRSGRHVVVDKPAFLGPDVTARMATLAAKRNVCLAEATVFGYHPQVAAIKEQFESAGALPHRLVVTFSIPPMDPTNFRYQRELGGGAIWDLGPYAVSVGRAFWDTDPDDVTGKVLTVDTSPPAPPRRGEGRPGGVETAFATLCTYPEGRSVVGTFGFDTVYRNRLDLIGDQVGIEVDRFFTTPPDLANELRITRRGGTETFAAPQGDMFARFFDHVIGRIHAGDWAQLTNDMRRDATALHRLRQAAGVS